MKTALSANNWVSNPRHTRDMSNHFHKNKDMNKMP